VVITRSITRPIAKAVRILGTVARGDLTERLNVDSNDEVGRMSQALDTLIDTLRVAFGSINEQAGVLAVSSEELAEISSQIAGNAEETSAQSTVVSAAAEQVSANVSSAAAGAEQMSASINEIAKNANDASRVAIGAAEEAATTRRIMTQLSEASNEIGDVAKLIQSIAEQTNLLALNATIEAARAGDAGKGFAVVASEVKDLAKQTTEATAAISGRIDAIQCSSSDAVAAIGRINDVIAEISAAQTSIAVAVEEQTATAAEIGRSVSEAAMGTNEIAGNITGVALAATTTAEGTSRSLSAAGDLSRVAAELTELVGQFRC
jgi:methyl-accepting chemotaxis protein